MFFCYLRENLRRIFNIVLWGNNRLARECHPAGSQCGRLVCKEAMPDMGTVKGLLNSLKCRWASRGVTPLRTLGFMGVVFIAAQPMTWGYTYYLRADGSAANKSFATGCSSPETAMDISTHNQQSFSPGDKIVLCDEGGVFRAGL